jgi:hypothetical protein
MLSVPMLPVLKPSLPARLHRPLAAVVLGAALLVPLQAVAPAVAAPPPVRSASNPHAAERATQAALTAYGDVDSSGRIHLSGSLRWANGKVLGHAQHVELWARSGKAWTLVRHAVTDGRGDVELSVTPGSHTRYQLRYPGSRSTHLSSVAAPSASPSVTVHALGQVTLQAPAKARRGETFVVTGRVTPAGAGHVVMVAGDGHTYTTLRTRADGSFSAHVRLRMTTTLSAVLPATASLDGDVSGSRTVRVA